MNNQQTGPDPDSVREEAERLVAAGLAAVSMVADRIGAPSRERGGAAAAGYDALGDMLFGPSGQRRHTVANDSAACCRCPVCRMISAARQPSPDVAERLATGFGNLAEGATRVLRTVAGSTGTTAAGTMAAGTTAGGGPGPASTAAAPAGSVPAEPARPVPEPVPEPVPDPEQVPDPWAAATRAAR